VFNYVVSLCVCRQKILNDFRWKTCSFFLIFHMSYRTVISIFASVKSLCVQKKYCHLIIWDLFWLYHLLSHTLYFSHCVHQLKKVFFLYKENVVFYVLLSNKWAHVLRFQFVVCIHIIQCHMKKLWLDSEILSILFTLYRAELT